MKKITRIFFLFIFTLGLITFCYPGAMNLYYQKEITENKKIFQSKELHISKEEKARRIRLAKKYNEALFHNFSNNYYDENKDKNINKLYYKMLLVDKKMGYVNIPKIHQDLPIYGGTDEYTLSIGVGHVKGTSLPIGGTNTNSVLAAHTGYPGARLFTDLTELKIGDKFFINDMAGTLAYKVDKMKVISPNNTSELKIVPGKDYCTLLTCTGKIIGIHHEKRLIVRGVRVKYIKPTKGQEKQREREDTFAMIKSYKIYIIFFVILVLYSIKKIYDHLKLKKLKTKKVKE